MKKKLIVLFLIFFLSFGLFSVPHKEEPQAASVALGYAAFKIGVSFTAFATYATWFYANGYTMPVQELITAFANKYYDYSMGVYTEKPTKINVLEKLNLYTSAVLTGNVANIPNAFDLQAIRDSVTEEFPQKVDAASIIPDYEYSMIENYHRFPQYYSSASLPSSLVYNNQGFYDIRDDFINKIVKINYRTSYPDYFYYAEFINYGWVQSGSYYYPTIRVIDASGKAYKVVLDNSNANLSLGNVNTTTQDFDVRLQATGSNLTGVTKLRLFRNNYVYTDDPLGLYSTAENSYSQGTADWVNPYPVYYPALNSKAATADELLGLMNVDEYLQREIARMIEEQDRTKERPLVLPQIEAGKVVYPGTQSGTDEGDTPSTGIDVPAGWWDRVLDIPGDIVTGLTPGLDIIRDRVNDIPTTINNFGLSIKEFFGSLWDTLFGFLTSIVDILTAIKDWLLGLGDFLISLIVPLDFDWTTFFDPVITAFNDKFAPILTPISEIAQGLHGEDLEDIYVNIDTPMFKQRVKVISYDSIKSVRDTVQWVVRAFFWILILLFNIDQLYRLIRNQSLFNTYVHRLEAQYKEDNPAPKQQPLITYLHRK